MAEKETKAPPHPEQLAPSTAHKNQPVGPKTGKLLEDWRFDRDYEKFNPTAEK